MSKKKMVMIWIAFALVLVIAFVFTEKRQQILPFPYHSLKIDNQYVKITMEPWKSPNSLKFPNCIVMTEEQDIAKCVEAINSVKLRKVDFIDEMLDSGIDPEPAKTRCKFTLEKEDGTVDVFMYVRDQKYIKYNNTCYVTRGEMPEYFWNLDHEHSVPDRTNVNKLEGVILELDAGEYSKDSLTVSGKLRNETEEEYEYGSTYYLEYMKNGGWSAFSTKQSGDTAKKLQGHAEALREYPLKEDYYVLESGTYRIVEEVTDSAGNTYYIATKFNISE